MPQMPPVEIGPERVEKDKLGICGLPEQEVRKALLTGGPDGKVDVGNGRLVQVTGEQFLVDLLRAEFPRRHIRGDRGGRVSDLGPSPVVHAELQGQYGIPGGQLLRGLEFADDATPELRPAAGPAAADAHLVEQVPATVD